MNDRLEPALEADLLQQPHGAGPLQIAYTKTEVVREAAVTLRRNRLIVNPQRSPLSEAFKVLRTQVLQRMRQNGWRSLAVTSVGPSLGKSIACVNLALSVAAEFDKTALLVDADLREPRIGTLFGLTQRAGLRDILQEGAELASLIINPGIAHLVVLPAGASVANSAELLATDATTRLIHELETRYPERYILFDAPPVQTPDALTLFDKVDAVLLVAERNRTKRRELQDASDILRPFNLIGSVLCDAAEEDEEGHLSKTRPARGLGRFRR